jgi:hypothetical protein
MCRALLVPNKYVFDLLAVVEAIVDRDNHSAGKSEYDIHSLSFQSFE